MTHSTGLPFVSRCPAAVRRKPAESVTGGAARNDRGFSLIELVIVMLLVGVLSVVVSTNGAGLLPGVRVRAAAERIASDIRYAQNLAIKEGGRVGVVFNTATNRYLVVRNLTTPVPAPFDTGRNLEVLFGTEKRFGGVSLLAATFGGGSTLQFDNLGVPRDAAYAELTANGTVSVTGGGTTTVVTVSAITGKVTF